MTVTNYKYHSTNQFRNVVKNIKEQTAFQGIDEEGNVIKDYDIPCPKLRYIGTTKLHGTNASIVIHEDGTVSFHSKSKLLGYVRDNEFTLHSDNAGFAREMWDRWEGVQEIVQIAHSVAYENYPSLGKDVYPIKISGEWCGQGIQKNVGISFLPRKSLFLFGMKVKEEWLPSVKQMPLESEDYCIYNIMSFASKCISIDFNKPELSQNDLVKYTNEVEDRCPVSAQLSVTESLLGEGLVWIPLDQEYAKDSGNWFKTKGQKHSVSKVKSVAEVDVAKIESIEKFVDYAVTENRLEQRLQEVGLDNSKYGEFIGWVNRDINKEELDTLQENGLTMKDVGKASSNKARLFYKKKLEEL